MPMDELVVAGHHHAQPRPPALSEGDDGEVGFRQAPCLVASPQPALDADPASFGKEEEQGEKRLSSRLPGCRIHAHALLPGDRSTASTSSMAFHSLMMQLVADLRLLLSESPVVVELGNQTFKPRRGDFEQLDEPPLRTATAVRRGAAARDRSTQRRCTEREARRTTTARSASRRTRRSTSMRDTVAS